MKLSEQQEAIVNASPNSMCIIACAGSGKTETAVHRLAKLRNDMADHRGYIALLSFTNTAVKTFRDSYSRITQGNTNWFKEKVFIETLDSFITSNILRPHAYRQMNCKITPFLVSGSESFLNNKKLTYWYETSSGDRRAVPAREINNVTIRDKDGELGFYYLSNNQLYPINNGVKVTTRLGSYGAYTHELGKYWSLVTLNKNKSLLRAIKNRFPVIIIDEAQDVDFLHSLILRVLHEEGVELTLIGDPHQAIYEFSGADGEFICNFYKEVKNKFSLSTNYRSIPIIVNLASSISKRNDEPHRVQEHTDHGVYYTLYDKDNPEALINSFTSRIQSVGLNIQHSVVLYRSWSGVNKLYGLAEIGQGKTQLFARATIKRDKDKNYREAFDLVISSLIGLFKSLPDNFVQLIKSDLEYRQLKQLIWRFVRDPSTGLPSGSLLAKTEWHSAMKSHVIDLLNQIEENYGYKPQDRVGNILASTRLPDDPLVSSDNLLKEDKCSIRVDTVHQAKGESLDAVLYIPTTKQHLNEMFNGTETEVGRIGYVALTRAKNFFVIGLDNNWIGEFESKLSDLGINLLS